MPSSLINAGDLFKMRSCAWILVPAGCHQLHVMCRNIIRRLLHRRSCSFQYQLHYLYHAVHAQLSYTYNNSHIQYTFEQVFQNKNDEMQAISGLVHFVKFCCDVTTLQLTSQ